MSKVKDYTTWKADLISYWSAVVSGKANQSDLITQISTDLTPLDSAYAVYKTFLSTSLKEEIEGALFTFFIYTILNDIVKIKEVDISGVNIPDFRDLLKFYLDDLPAINGMYTYSEIPDMIDPMLFFGTLTPVNFVSTAVAFTGYSGVDTDNIVAVKDSAQAKVMLRTNYHIEKYDTGQPMPKINNLADDVLIEGQNLLASKINITQLETDMGWTVNKIYLNEIRMLPE